MVLLESITIPLGTKMPDFKVKDPEGKALKGTDQYGERGLLLVFTCNHCPYALAVWPRSARLISPTRHSARPSRSTTAA